jgi:hypothetical protein
VVGRGRRHDLRLERAKLFTDLPYRNCVPGLKGDLESL